MRGRRDFTTAEIADLLAGMRDAKCRSSYAQGCRCPIHGDGFPSAGHRQPNLAIAGRREARLVAVADESGVTFADTCDGSMTCRCERCCEQRAVLVRHPRHTPRQPWQPLPAVRAA